MNKKTLKPKLQHTLLYRIVAFISRLKVEYLIRTLKNTRWVIILFAVVAGVSAIAILSSTAYLTNLPLLFPPLAPSALILFYMPMSETASPRNLIMGHGFSLLSGLFSLQLVSFVFPDTGVVGTTELNFHQILAISVAMGLSSALMIWLRCVHPPAAATALIASMGFISNQIQVYGFISAIILLAVEAYIFIRIIGGIPYPLWRFDPRTAIHYKELSGRSDAVSTNWEELSKQIFLRRK